MLIPTIDFLNSIWQYNEVASDITRFSGFVYCNLAEDDGSNY